MKRRDFLKTSGVLAGATAISSLGVARSAHAAGSDLIKLALVGCGGRGRGALQQRLGVNDNVKVVPTLLKTPPKAPPKRLKRWQEIASI